MPNDDLDRARAESAELLGLNPECLSPANRLRCDLVSALRAAIDDELGKVDRANAADLGRLIVAVEALTKFLKESPADERTDDDDDDDDPLERLKEIVARHIAAKEAQRAEDKAELRAQGLPANEQEAAAMRIASLEAEVAHLRSKHNDNEPVVEGEVLKPEQEVPTDIKPVAQSWTGPKDGCPSWLRKVPPVKPEDRPSATPVVAKSGDETKAQMARSNADRATAHRIMTEPGRPWEPQPSRATEPWRGYTKIFK